MSELTIAALVLLAVVALVLSQAILVVQQQEAVIIERLGRYRETCSAGIHLLIPFVDVARYKLSLKEDAIDIPEQTCITRDNVQVGVDGIIYLRIMEPSRAVYGVENFRFAVTQLAQTALRSEMGKIDLDRSFEERNAINHAIVLELDKATEPWGVKVLRYELKNINPPRDVAAAMEKQMRAEREKRAVILASEGQRDAWINAAEGKKRAKILHSEGHAEAQVNRATGTKQARVLSSEGRATAWINRAAARAEGEIKRSDALRQQQAIEARGRAEAIATLASAEARALVEVGTSFAQPGADTAMQLRLAENYLTQFGKLAREGTSMILPADLANPAAIVRTAVAVGTQMHKGASSHV